MEVGVEGIYLRKQVFARNWMKEPDPYTKLMFTNPHLLWSGGQDQFSKIVLW